jgi:hypothetical protein
VPQDLLQAAAERREKTTATGAGQARLRFAPAHAFGLAAVAELIAAKFGVDQ